MKRYKLDKTKNIGTVIFVVEGGNAETGGMELRLLKQIFSEIMKYEVHELRRGSEEFIGYGENKFSRVFALNLPKNQLTELTNESIDNLFRRIRKELKVKPEDCPIFYLYDRDYLSYKPNELRKKYVQKYVNPYTNEFGDQGQLLLSYPSVESYLQSCFKREVYKTRCLLGKHLKGENAKEGISVNKILHDCQITRALEEMNDGLYALGIKTYDIDNLGGTLLDVYDLQQNLYKAEKTFSALSLISMALLELGVIVEDADEESA